MVIAFCGLNEPVPLLPQDFINAVGTSRDLKLFTMNELKLLPYLNNFLQTGQFNKIGIYDLNDNENIDLHADTVAEFLFKMPNCGASNSNVLAASNVLNISSKGASADRKPLEAIINQVKKVKISSIDRETSFCILLAVQSKFVHEEFDVVNKHTGQYLRLTVRAGYCFELTTIKDELNPDEETELQQILKF
ncbi:hypothetical protein Ddc_15765 [Ditylenchus destructor]|nr:hypothetical protein Ddc_15765 [Ditylenchus destructor]